MPNITTPEEIRKIVATQVYEMIVSNDYAPNYEHMMTLAVASDKTLIRILEKGIGSENRPWTHDDILEYGL